MLGRLRSDVHLQRLIASLVMNFVAKAPSLISVFLVLPLLARDLGTARYSLLLGALALGGSFAGLFNGINATTRREIAFTEAGQVPTVVTAVTSCLLTALVAGAVCAAISIASYPSWFPLIALLPILAAALNLFDNVRAAFNQHYVTAGFQFVLQSVTIGLVLWHGPPGGLTMAALVLTGPLALASLTTGVLLALQRPELFRKGAARPIGPFLKHSLRITLADGAIFAALGLSVYWYGQHGSAPAAAVYGTLSRIFQTLLAPILLIMLPICGFVAVRWQGMSARTQLRVHRAFAGLALVYGVLVLGIVALLSPFILSRIYHLALPDDAPDLLAIGLLMGAIVAQKIYSQLIYSVEPGTFFSRTTTTATLTGVGMAAVGSAFLGPTGVLNLFGAIVGVLLTAAILFDNLRRRSDRRDDGKNPQDPVGMKATDIAERAEIAAP